MVLVAFGSGICLALYLFPIGFLLGTPQYWDNIQGDTATNWIGYVSFAHDEWRWPLFRTVLINSPQGSNILFSDSIPLLALLGKLIFKVTGWLPNYFGPWVLLSYALQPTMGYLVLREARLTRLASLVGGVLFLLVPAFIFRIGHIALLGHWILLLALLVYLRIVNRGDVRNLYQGLVFTVLLVFVHPYLLVMTAALYIASLGDGLLRRTLSPCHALAALVLLGVSIPSCAILFDFIDPTKPFNTVGGFGFYSMNSLSPIWPQLSAWPGQAHFILDATGGQYEGYNYLGLGLLVVIATAILTAPLEVARLLRKHVFLTLAVLIMGLYAMSSQVYFANTLVVSLPYERLWLLHTFTDIFRSSGRFFWLVCYFLLLLAASTIFSSYGQRYLIALVLFSIIAQLADIRPLLERVSSSTAPAKELVETQSWRTEIRQHDELVVYPQSVCTTERSHYYIRALGLQAVMVGKPSNLAFTGRPETDCAEESRLFTSNLRSLATRQNPLVVAIKDYMNAAIIRTASRAAGMVCRDADFSYVCSPEHSAAGLAKLGGDLGSPPTVKQNEVAGIGEGQRGTTFLTAGWALPEDTFVWGVGPVSSLSITLAEPICGHAVVSLRISPFATTAHTVDHANIVLNEQKPIPFVLSGPGETTVDVPYSQEGCTSFFNVALQFSMLKSPRELGISADPRLLSWRLISFSIAASK